MISIELNKYRNGLLFRDWHLRDCAWFEDEAGHVCGVTRKWKPTKRQLVDTFGDKVHQKIKEDLDKKPFDETNIRHLVLPSEMYGDEEIRNPYVSVYVDVTNQHIIEAIGINHKYYVVPRFQTIAGSAYAYSPATVVGLPDARALQAMTHTLLEAGERYARPPIIATQRAIRSDIDLSTDGITWLDPEYDERMGEAIRTLQQDRGGFPIGLEMRNNIVEVLSSAFYLNKLTLPEVTREMTAYEVAERMKQFRRENLPLFSPMESEYNGQVCETAFEVAMQAGLLGSPYDIPDSLKGRDVQFKFHSPLSQSEEEKKVNQFAQLRAMLAEAAEIDPSVAHNADLDTAFRDAVNGMGAPEQWLRSVEDVIAIKNIEQLQAATEAAATAQTAA